MMLTPAGSSNAFFLHLGEVACAGKTDHLALYRKLMKGGAKKYLFYQVDNNDL
ncbi:MAG: hypothetical protein HYX75_14075 [Acidobacteria bacterium]|nr:hypothetical protein [Acidobacteriota bacterium]